MTHGSLVRLVRRRIRDEGMTPYRLHQRLEPAASKQTVYNFVGRGRPVRSDTLVAMLGELGLEVAVRQRRKRR